MLAIPEEDRSKSKQKRASNSPKKERPSTARSNNYGRNSSSYRSMRNDMKASKSSLRNIGSKDKHHATRHHDHSKGDDDCHRHDFAHNFYMNKMSIIRQDLKFI